ncbi:Ppx/GppA phosphatase family protein [Sporichthya sp.]|uniref:Ppx/GppA phosphatase family protein n=1 Tax=Sporichthya sp. TaxID=65475 RepID=UPI0018287090|nr:Ppx/GppA phosphatase family protein [Sporichthya sp.]MBA3741608.1 Ppx/GppA family phosphatase [Sporichthya sp.]
MRVAGIDCGTNSIRLLIADLTPDGLVDVDRRMLVVRLGQGVDATGRLAPEALERTFAAARTYAEAIREAGVDRVRFVATSATRDAENAAEFRIGIAEILGIEPEVITGEQEAALSFAGATDGLANDPQGGGLARPYLVVDVGGGSTEFVLGDLVHGRGTVQASRSVDVGCVRMRERRLHGDPPNAVEIAAATADIDAAIDLAAEVVPLKEAQTLIGVAGTVTTIAAIALGLETYDPVAIHGSRIPAVTVHEIAARLLAATREERAAISVMHPGRVDVIGAGALVVDRIVTRLGDLDLVVSEHDILDGIAASIAR